MQPWALAYGSSCLPSRSVSYRCSQLQTVSRAAVPKFAIQLSSPEHPEGFVTLPCLNFACLVCLTIFLWSILPKQDVCWTCDSELSHSLECCIVRKAVTQNYLAGHSSGFRFCFVFSGRLMTAGTLAVDALLGSPLKFTYHVHYFSSWWHVCTLELVLDVSFRWIGSDFCTTWLQ